MFSISREIQIDAGHRVHTHGSKCANLHGHRYHIEAVCSAVELQEEGEQSAMVLDFGFLKNIMMEYIDKPCDHGMILDVNDPWLHYFLEGDLACTHVKTMIFNNGLLCLDDDRHVPDFKISTMGKLYIVDFIPTAEKLAEHWFKRMCNPVHIASNGGAELQQVHVHETPNCIASYRPDKKMSAIREEVRKAFLS